jgi:hypothetical protein
VRLARRADDGVPDVVVGGRAYRLADHQVELAVHHLRRELLRLHLDVGVTAMLVEEDAERPRVEVSIGELVLRGQ